MLTTKTGNVSAPLLMNVDDRMGSCRDKGWIWGRVGALCLSLVATRSSGDCVEQTGRTPTRTSTRPPHPPRPLSLQDAGRTFLDSIVKHHQDAGDASVPMVQLPDSIVTIL